MRKILFDLFGVLMKNQSPEGQAKLEEFVDLDGQGVDRADFWGKYRELREPLDSGRWGYVEYLEMLGTDLGLVFPDIEGFVQTDYETWSEPNTEMVDYARELVADGNEVGVLSNVPTALLSLLGEDQDWITMFQPRIFSGVVGMVKPNRDIFELTAAVMESDPGDVLFIDDDERNIAAAREFGFNAHHYSTPERAREAVSNFLAGADVPEDEKPTS